MTQLFWHISTQLVDLTRVIYVAKNNETERVWHIPVVQSPEFKTASVNIQLANLLGNSDKTSR